MCVLDGGRWWTVRVDTGGEELRLSALEVTRGQISSQSPRDATRFWWHLYGS